MKKIVLLIFSFTSIFACQDKLRRTEQKPTPQASLTSMTPSSRLDLCLDEFKQLLMRKKSSVAKQLAMDPTNKEKQALIRRLTETETILWQISFHSNYMQYADASDDSVMSNLRRAVDAIPCFIQLPYRLSSRYFKEKIEEEIMRMIIRTNPEAKKTCIVEGITNLEKLLHDEKSLQMYMASPSLSEGNPHKMLKQAREIISVIKPHLALLEELRSKIPDPKLRASFSRAHNLNYEADIQKIKCLIQSIPSILFAPGSSTHYFKLWIPKLLDILDEEERQNT